MYNQSGPPRTPSSKQLARVLQPGSPDNSTPAVPLPALNVPAEEWLQVAIHGESDEVREVLVEAAAKLVEEKKRILGLFQHRIDVSLGVLACTATSPGS